MHLVFNFKNKKMTFLIKYIKYKKNIKNYEKYTELVSI